MIKTMSLKLVAKVFLGEGANMLVAMKSLAGDGAKDFLFAQIFIIWRGANYDAAGFEKVSQAFHRRFNVAIQKMLDRFDKINDIERLTHALCIRNMV